MGLSIPKEDLALLGGVLLFAYGVITNNTQITEAGIVIGLGGKALGSIGVTAT